MKKKIGFLLITLIIVYSVQGFNVRAESSVHGDKLLAQNAEQETQNKKQETQSDASRKTLDELYNQIGQKVIPLEIADNMLKDARTISLNDLNDEQADKLMRIYRGIAAAYAANFRFKPACVVFDEYITIKNTYLQRFKTQRLKKIEIETNQLKDDNTLKISANEGQLANLQTENESLAAAKRNVYTTIWIVVLIVAFCSGAVIWFINHKYSKAKHQLAVNRNRMMEVVFTSAIGEFSRAPANGNGNLYLTGLEQLKGNLSKLSETVSSQNKTAKNIVSLLSRLKEVISKL